MYIHVLRQNQSCTCIVVISIYSIITFMCSHISLHCAILSVSTFTVQHNNCTQICKCNKCTQICNNRITSLCTYSLTHASVHDCRTHVRLTFVYTTCIHRSTCMHTRHMYMYMCKQWQATLHTVKCT